MAYRSIFAFLLTFTAYSACASDLKYLTCTDRDKKFEIGLDEQNSKVIYSRQDGFEFITEAIFSAEEISFLTPPLLSIGTSSYMEKFIINRIDLSVDVVGMEKDGNLTTPKGDRKAAGTCKVKQLKKRQV